MTPMHSLLTPGGRIKAASQPVGILQNDPNGKVRQILSGEDPSVNLAFFPRVGRELRQYIDRQPLRPYISTHQGMPGNFYPFMTGRSQQDSIYHYVGGGFEAVAEPRFSLPENVVKNFQECMNGNDFGGAYQILQGIPEAKKAQSKGRTPFFICRPSETKEITYIDPNLIPKIDGKAGQYLEQCLDTVGGIYKQNTLRDMPESYRNSVLETLLYFQADVYIPRQGDPIIEGLQLPDVGFFLEKLSDTGALKEIKSINRELRSQVVDAIKQQGYKSMVFLTGKNVISGKEDLLEQGDIDILSHDLTHHGIGVDAESVESFEFNKENTYILMNFHYTPRVKQKLIELAIRYPENFSPNPLLQLANKGETQYKKITLSGKGALDRFRGLTFYNDKQSEEQFFSVMRDYFATLGLNPDTKIITITKANGETLYVYRDSLYSLRKIKSFLENEPFATIVENPYQHGSSRIQKDGYDILHTYRFMYAKK